MADQRTTHAFPLIFRQNADGSEAGYIHFIADFIDDSGVRVHDVPDYFSVDRRDEIEFLDEILVTSHEVHKVMLGATGKIEVPKRFPRHVLHFPVIARGFVPDYQFQIFLLSPFLAIYMLAAIEPSFIGDLE
jgi:hypothetical protein